MLSNYQLTNDFFDLEKVIHLYQQSFPENERGPFQLLLNPSVKTYIYYDENQFIGFISILKHLDIINIIYFAIEPAYRHRGYGSTILKKLKQQYPNNRIVVDIEDDTIIANNSIQRHKRKQFYLKNNFRLTNIHYHWREEDYIILVDGNDITINEFNNFWKHFSKDETIKF